MNDILNSDMANQATILAAAVQAGNQFLQNLNDRPPAAERLSPSFINLPETGCGAAAALARFRKKYEAGLSGSAGPRYFGFVTGGATPAALAGDWLTAVYDQNVISDLDSVAPRVEQETIHLLRQLFGLPETFSGIFVNGATTSNFVGLAQARQWAAAAHGIDPAADGLYGLPPLPVLAATPHASAYKALAMLGMGRNQLSLIPTLPNREAMDTAALAVTLSQLQGPAIVIASAGTVNTGDFDDIEAMAQLRKTAPFWLHVDAAFGGFAACSPRLRHLLHGLSQADSLTIDAHKWLNVPYDSAMAFTRRPDLQAAVFQNSATYLGELTENPAPLHLSPQNSRRFYALPAWMTLQAYGREGYQEIVERNCDQAAWLAARIEQSAAFRLLAPARLNVVCFTLAGSATLAQINAYLQRLRADGRIFLTPTTYQEVPAIRAAFSNWRTTQADCEITWQALNDMVPGES